MKSVFKVIRTFSVVSVFLVPALSLSATQTYYQKVDEIREYQNECELARLNVLVKAINKSLKQIKSKDRVNVQCEVVEEIQLGRVLFFPKYVSEPGSVKVTIEFSENDKSCNTRKGLLKLGEMIDVNTKGKGFSRDLTSGTKKALSKVGIMIEDHTIDNLACPDFGSNCDQGIWYIYQPYIQDCLE